MSLNRSICSGSSNRPNGVMTKSIWWLLGSNAWIMSLLFISFTRRSCIIYVDQRLEVIFPNNRNQWEKKQWKFQIISWISDCKKNPNESWFQIMVWSVHKRSGNRDFWQVLYQQFAVRGVTEIHHYWKITAYCHFY